MGSLKDVNICQTNLKSALANIVNCRSIPLVQLKRLKKDIKLCFEGLRVDQFYENWSMGMYDNT